MLEGPATLDGADGIRFEFTYKAGVRLEWQRQIQRQEQQWQRQQYCKDRMEGPAIIEGANEDWLEFTYKVGWDEDDKDKHNDKDYMTATTVMEERQNTGRPSHSWGRYIEFYSGEGGKRNLQICWWLWGGLSFSNSIMLECILGISSSYLVLIV